MSQECYSRLEMKTLIRGHARRPEGVTRNAPTPSTAVYPSPSAMLALESCSACFSIEHRVVVNRMLRHGLDDIPVFCDLSAFHSKQVDDGIALIDIYVFDVMVSAPRIVRRAACRRLRHLARWCNPAGEPSGIFAGCRPKRFLTACAPSVRQQTDLARGIVRPLIWDRVNRTNCRAHPQHGAAFR